jgi:DNA repair protein RadD
VILRPYQSQGIQDIRAAFSQGIRRICYVAPPRSGKGTMVAFMAREAAKRGNRTLFIVHRQELIDQIAEAIGEPHALIHLDTAQTVVRRLSRIPRPDLIISDEFHHGLAATWRKIFTYFPEAWLVGLTATPARLGGQGLGEICDRLIIGPSVKELIRQGYLAPFKYFAPPMPVDLTGIKIKLGDYDQTEIAVRMDKPHITGSAISHYQKLADGKQAIVYCASIEHSRNTVAAFIAAGYSARHVDGETPRDERREAVEAFKAGRLQVMSNVDLFGEGLNLPGVETVILLRPTASLTLHIQQSMRSMTWGPGKTAVIIDAAGNCYRHGLPDEDREWSLDGIKKRPRNEEPAFSVRVCPRCFSVHRPAGECPYCGWLYAPEPREVKMTPGELAEIREVERKKRRMEVGRARTVEDLKRIAAERGYRPQWVYIQAKIKGIRR